MAATIGVLLSGCGVNDGSEIHEAVSILIALDRRGARAGCDVNDGVAGLLTAMHAAGKPIGLACIAPVIAARVLGVPARGPA